MSRIPRFRNSRSDHHLRLDESDTLDFEEPADRVFVVAGHLQTSKRREAIRHAVEDICQQASFDRTVVPCIWEAQSSWGIQAVDYALWAVQRRVEGKSVPDYCGLIDAQIRSTSQPWGT